MRKGMQVQLKTSSILTVPIQNYVEDFTFIVNDKEFKTTKLVSDLLSPIICKIHTNDPTIDRFTFNTRQQGDFSHFIKLANFESTTFSKDDIPFLSEVIETLGNKSIELDYEEEFEITNDNVLSLLQQHEKFPIFYCNHLLREIDFTSSHFFELCENQEEELRKLTIDTIIKILNNDQLRLKSEDQLLKFINELYSNNSEYTILYETVLFTNVSSEAMKEFVYTYNPSEMSLGTWKELSKRLCEEVQRKPESESKHSARYSEPQSWVIQGSNDNNSWETIDEEKDCSILNGNSVVHTFTMNHPKPTKFKYIRMYSTGPNWSNNNYLAFESFEIYGIFI
ncbi:hypothetical protein M9Y10_027380 [Tritrichomonas musculus]|uniref:BACK domain-containing protein n=1 Tax=Tritrichomonas musculus TaxID=1915356 RepID=A0ABR2H4P1_9EUKA